MPRNTPLPLPQPLSVILRWVPNTMHLVQFRAWGRTFVVALARIRFLTPQAQAPLYLSGSVQVSMLDIRLSGAEQQIFDVLRLRFGRDDVTTPANARQAGAWSSVSPTLMA